MWYTVDTQSWVSIKTILGPSHSWRVFFLYIYIYIRRGEVRHFVSKAHKFDELYNRATSVVLKIEVDKSTRSAAASPGLTVTLVL